MDITQKQRWWKNIAGEKKKVYTVTWLKKCKGIKDIDCSHVKIESLLLKVALLVAEKSQVGLIVITYIVVVIEAKCVWR